MSGDIVVKHFSIDTSKQSYGKFIIASNLKENSLEVYVIEGDKSGFHQLIAKQVGVSADNIVGGGQFTYFQENNIVIFTGTSTGFGSVPINNYGAVEDALKIYFKSKGIKMRISFDMFQKDIRNETVWQNYEENTYQGETSLPLMAQIFNYFFR